MNRKMRNISLGFLGLTLMTTATADAQQSALPHIIPEPVQMDSVAGTTHIFNHIKIISAIKSTDVRFSIQSFEQHFAQVHCKLHEGVTDVHLELLPTKNSKIGEEGYVLSTDHAGVHIQANTEQGLYYGLQTLEQIANAVEQKTDGSFPALQILDYPKVGWRGMLLDVARHFFTKEDVKKYIDEISAFKFNIIQLHLTDDGGWRMEIKAYPNLTKVGAWGVEKYGHYGDFSPALPTDKYNYGGFYTQADLKEIIAYAKEHFVDILPEIDVPGHSMAAVVSYPELAGAKGANKYKVYSGEEGFMDWTDSGIVSRYDNTLNPAKDLVYTFVDKVMSEVAALFPFPYIHIGGDECAKNYWKKDPKIRLLMQREHLKDYDEVQSYFEKKIVKIVASKGKKVIGWDEILEGGVADDATIMSWRGMKGGITAAKLKHDVIMTPNDFVYIDLMQGNKAIEAPVYESLRLNKVYQFNPFPAGIDAQYVKGGQANLWTEQVYDFPKVEYMTWPRSLAVAESVWSPNEKKNWQHFVSKVETQMQTFDRDSIEYAPSMYEPDCVTTVGKDGLKHIRLVKEIDDVALRYTFDGSFPVATSRLYTDSIVLPKDALLLRIQAYRNGRPVGRLLSIDTKTLETK